MIDVLPSHTMASVPLVRQLRDRELPEYFGDSSFDQYTCDQLCKIIKLFDWNARGLSSLRKVLLVQRLVQLKPRPLKRAEIRAVESIRDGDTLEQARTLLPPPRPRGIAKLRSDSGKRRRISHNNVRPASSPQKDETKNTSAPTLTSRSKCQRARLLSISFSFRQKPQRLAVWRHKASHERMPDLYG